MAEANRDEAERACRRAEEHFLAGNVAAACRLAGKAKRLFPSLPGVANAVAAYAVHASAPDWHAVLGVDRPASADAVKRQFRRLSLLVHPDKNHCAAAEGAFKLLRKACDALSSGGHYATDAASAQEWFRTHHSKPAKEPSWKPATPKNPPPPSADKAESSSQAASGAARLVRVRCDYCKKAREVKRIELTCGLVRCLGCHSVLREPSRTTYVWESSGTYYQVRPPSPPPYYQASPPPPPQKKKKEPQVPTFRCPARCPRCETQFTSMVSTGSWLLQCKNCLKDAMVHVKGPDAATCA